MSHAPQRKMVFLIYTIVARVVANEDKIVYATQKELDELVVKHHIFTDLWKYRRQWEKADKEIRDHQFWQEYMGLDPDYAMKVIETNISIKEEADAEIKSRKPVIEAMRYAYLSDEEASTLLGTYVDHIDVDLNGHLEYLSYKDEFRRIMKYDFRH